MSASAADTARPTNAAIAWATKDAIFVEFLCKDMPPYLVRYPRTVAGLASAFNILIDNPERPSNGKARTVPAKHPAIRRPAVEFTESEREAARLALKKAGIT